MEQLSHIGTARLWRKRTETGEEAERGPGVGIGWEGCVSSLSPAGPHVVIG